VFRLHALVIEGTIMISGGTLCKGLNRGLGTLLAGSLAFFIRYLADVPGQIFRAIFIGAAVFILGKHLLHHERNLSTLGSIIVPLFVEVLREVQSVC
jgi:hypothetical protein